MLLSDRFLGFFMVPAQGSWNYNFMGKLTFVSIIKITETDLFIHSSSLSFHLLPFRKLQFKFSLPLSFISRNIMFRCSAIADDSIIVFLQ